MNKKMIFAILLLCISTLCPACKHEKLDSAQIYLRYLQSRIHQ